MALRDNDCGRGDTVSLTAAYGGRNSSGVDIGANATCNSNPDGISEVEFGTLPNGTVAYTCWWGSGGGIRQSDMRLNKADDSFSTDEATSCSGAYNIDDVATHERGHSVGLGDMTSSADANLTMYHLLATCETKKETLGLGDMLRLESLY